MNKEVEIGKIQRELKIPVTDIEFFPTYVEIVSGKENIGGIPYYNVAGIYSYDSDTNAVNWLKWEKVYNQHKNELDQKVADLIDDSDIVIALGTFRRLYAKKSNGDFLCAVNCFYENDWTVEKE